MHKQALLVALLSLVSAFSFNDCNLQLLRKEFPAEYEKRCTIGTSDDASYLTPADNLLKGNGWHSNDVGSGAWIFRTPGYGAFYLICKVVAGENALFLLRYVQLLLFAISIYLLCISCYLLTNNKILTLIISIIYGVLPIMQGFIYYSLTEGITPFLVILFTYFIIRASKDNSIRQFYLASVTLAVLIIVRPQMLLLYFALLPLYISFRKSGISYSVKTFIFTTVISFSLLIVWQIRNYTIVNRWVPLNAVYNPDNNSIFRPQHKAIGEFYKSFGADGSLFHQSVNLLWQHAVKGDTSVSYINEIIAEIPEKIISSIGHVNIVHAFKLYQQCSFEQKYFVDNNLPMPTGKRISEEKCINVFNDINKKVIADYPFETKIQVPVNAYYKMAAHSNLSLHIFQQTWRSKWWMEVLRWKCFIIHFSIFIIYLFQILFKKDKLSVLLLVVPLIYLFYLCYFQVMNEERYTLPVIPLLLFGSVRVIHFIFQKLKSA